MNKKVSIIIPIYNVEDFLTECLESIVHQTLDDIEALLIDDGSTDQSTAIALTYVDKYEEKFRYIKKENGGLSDARNHGIPLSRGEYILFLDSDDYLEYSACRELYDTAKQMEADLIVFNHTCFSSERMEIKKCIEGASRWISKKEYVLIAPTAWNKFMKRETYIKNEVKFPLGLWYEDRATTGSYVNFIDKIYYLDQPLYLYRQRENSIMLQAKYNDKMLDIITALEYTFKDLDTYKKEVEYLYISNLLFQSSLRMLPFNRFKELKLCVNVLKNKFPEWKQNEYYIKESKNYRFFCQLVANGHYRIAAFMAKIRTGE